LVARTSFKQTKKLPSNFCKLFIEAAKEILFLMAVSLRPPPPHLELNGSRGGKKIVPFFSFRKYLFLRLPLHNTNENMQHLFQ